MSLVPTHLHGTAGLAAASPGTAAETGLSAALRLLLEAAYEEARCLTCTHVLLELDGRGALSVFDSGGAVPARALLDALAHRTPFPGAPCSLRRAAWDALAAVRGAVRVEAWEAGRQWRALRTPDGTAWEVGELHPAHPPPAGAPRGSRLWCLPEAPLRAEDVEALALHGRALAFLAPGLEVRCTEAAGGAPCTFHYPRGLAQRAEELTASLPRLHPEPFAFDVRWGELRARCALQWCDVDGGLLLAYANTRRTSRYGPHVAACLHTVRAVLAQLAGVPPFALPSFRLMRGLTAVVSLDGPPEQVPASDEAFGTEAARALEACICERLYPLALEAFGAHPVTSRLLAQARTPA